MPQIVVPYKPIAFFSCTIAKIRLKENVMTEAEKVSSMQLSRRCLMYGVVCAAGATAILGTADSAMAEKIAQKTVAYQETPKGDQNCANCILFEAPTGCKAVDGTISPQGWCNLWAKK
jgi:hypothetical protein